MSAPPGRTALAEPVPGLRYVTDTDVTPKREALRLLRAELGLTGPEAHRLYRRYEHECAAGDFLAWVLTYADPTGERATRNVYRDRGF